MKIKETKLYNSSILNKFTHAYSNCLQSSVHCNGMKLNEATMLYDQSLNLFFVRAL